MAITPLGVGTRRLSIAYSAWGKPHVMRFYVPPFLSDAGVGTFDAPGTPATLDALATDLANVIKPMYTASSALSFGEWFGEQHTALTDNSWFPSVSGVVTGITAAFSVAPDNTGAPTQATWTFRDNDTKHVRYVQIGGSYFGPNVVRFSGISGHYLDFANYVLGSPRLLGRGGSGIASMISLTFDTNDRLQRAYRR